MGNINITNLKLGDIIFFTPPWDKRELQADHVAIVTKIDTENNECWVAHAVSGEKYNQAMQTILKQNNNDTAYQVYRCKDQKLAEIAADLAKQWTDLPVTFIPYSHSRANLVYKMEDSFNIEAQPEKGLPLFLEAAEKSYKENYFRIIKYASRRGSVLSQKKGLRCASFATLVIQLAEVVALVPTQESLGITWVTDKYGSDKLLSDVSFFKKFKTYQEKIRSSEEFNFLSQPEKEYQPRKEMRLSSLFLWDEGKNGDPEQYFLSKDRVLPLDSKLVTSSLLMFAFKNNTEHWNVVGKLHIENNEKNTAQKEEWREYIIRRHNLTQQGTERLNRRLSWHGPIYNNNNNTNNDDEERREAKEHPLLRRFSTF